MADELFIEDGYTRRHDIDARPGMHPAVAVVFRPAMDRERKKYDAALATKDVAKAEEFENDLIARHVKSLNGQPPESFRDKLSRLHPVVRAEILNVVLSYTPARWQEAEGNCGGGTA